VSLAAFSVYLRSIIAEKDRNGGKFFASPLPETWKIGTETPILLNNNRSD